MSESNPANGGSPFPRRRDVHGSRIPTSGDSPGPAQETAPAGGGKPALRDSISPDASARATARSYEATAGIAPQPAASQTPTPITPTAASKQVRPEVPVPARRSRVRRPDGADAAAESPSAQIPIAPQAAEVESIAEKRARKRRVVRRLRTTLILLALAALIGLAVWYAVDSLRGSGSGGSESDDYAGPGSGTVEVTVDPGDLGTDIGQKLYEADVVKSVAAFTRAFDANAASVTLKPGTYVLRQQMSGAGALAAMLDEANRRDNSVTVNAGQTVAQIRERLISVGGFSEEEVDAALGDSNAIGLPAAAEGKPEGWLAVGTYEVSTSDTAQSVISAMVARTVTVLTDLGVPEDQWMDVLTKASILERETASVEDMQKVARVIENRLTNLDAETVGFLQMDSTALYGVGKSGGIPTSEDLENQNPFNTYVVKGLPPTPIGSPSVQAIEATLNPSEGDWLYFVTVDLDTGETLFSSTLEEQTANIRLLEQWCAANKDRC